MINTKECNNVIQKENIWKYTNMNPSTPSLHMTIELRKPNAPIRPIINWKNTSAYELTKATVKNITKYLNLPYIHIHNSNQLMTELKAIELNKNVFLRYRKYVHKHNKKTHYKHIHQYTRE
jgi:hypothetical protein